MDETTSFKMATETPWDLTAFQESTLLVPKLAKLDQYHGCWCPGSLHHQDISSLGIDFVRKVGPWLSRRGISNVYIISISRNDRKCKHIFMFSKINSALQELNHRSSITTHVLYWGHGPWSSALCYFMGITIRIFFFSEWLMIQATIFNARRH